MTCKVEHSTREGQKCQVVAHYEGPKRSLRYGDDPHCRSYAHYTIDGTPMCKLHAGEKILELSEPFIRDAKLKKERKGSLKQMRQLIMQDIYGKQPN